MAAGLRSSSDGEHIGVQPPGSFNQRVFDWTDGDMYRCIGSDLLLQIRNALQCQLTAIR